MKLSGKSVIIIGGTKGIGAATARLAQEGAGLTVAARSPWSDEFAKEFEAYGNAQFVATDIARTADVRALVAAHLDRFGGIDVLFNNAAYEGSGALIADLTDDEIDRVLSTNVRGVIAACREVIPPMTSAGTE